MTGPRRRARPRRAAVPVLSSVGVLGAWFAIAHDSGTGWVQTIGALVAGALVVGLLAPAFAVSRLKVRITSSPADALAGAPATLHAALSGPAEVRPVSPPGPTAVTGRSPTVALEIRPPRRGIVESCTVEVASAAPFGLLWWTRTLTVALPRPMAVSPRAGMAARDLVGTVPDAPQPSGLPGRGTAVRGVRPYEPGDPRRLVHWPVSAHTGMLMVRETERPSPRTVLVDGALPDDPDAADERAGHLLATVADLLAGGCRVQLRTLEPDGDVVATVATAATAGRQLARALPRTEPG